MIYKIVFAIINIIAILFIPFNIYVSVGIIAAGGIIYLDMPRVKKILKEAGLESSSVWLYVVIQIILDTITWIYSLLNFSWVVFSGKWEKETNG